MPLCISYALAGALLGTEDRSSEYWHIGIPVQDGYLHMFTPEHIASRSGTSALDKPVRLWLAGLVSHERISFLKQLWPLNYRYALALAQGAQLSRRENEALLRHWLKAGNHNAAKELIRYLEPVLGEHRFWKVAGDESRTDEMRDFLDYHGQRQRPPVNLMLISASNNLTLSVFEKVTPTELPMNPSELVIHLEQPMNQLPLGGPHAREIVIAGLGWPTEYWPQLALAWLDEGLSIDAEIAALLLKISRQRAFSQRLRHQAFAIAMRWEKATTLPKF